VASHALLGALGAAGLLKDRGWLVLAVLASGFAAFVHCWRRLAAGERGDGDGRRSGRELGAGLLLVAAVLRIVLLPLPPVLSDDVYRYAWDGRVVLAGLNPYRWAPDAPELSALRAEHSATTSHGPHGDVPHGEVATVYPPLALGAFSIAALTPAPIYTLKTLMALADLVTCWLLLGLARRLGLAVSRVALYAWNPLVVLETAGMGHVDALAVAGAVAAVGWLLARPARAGAAGGAAALGVLAKLGPLAALPLWGRWLLGRDEGEGGGWRGAARFFGVCGLLLAVVGLPVPASVGGVPPGLVTYGVTWEWNGPLYEPLWRALDAADVAGAAARTLDGYKQATEEWTRWNFLYPWFYPQSFAKVLLGLGMMVWVGLSVLGARRAPLVATTGRLFGGLLLLSATLYPWYLLWVLPWAALGRHRAWLALSGLVLLSYLPQLAPGGGVPLWPGVFLFIWLPFWALLPGSRWSIS
jgi:alpha-1,6-mannosyltransferase